MSVATTSVDPLNNPRVVSNLVKLISAQRCSTGTSPTIYRVIIKGSSNNNGRPSGGHGKLPHHYGHQKDVGHWQEKEVRNWVFFVCEEGIWPGGLVWSCCSRCAKLGQQTNNAVLEVVRTVCFRWQNRCTKCIIASSEMSMRVISTN